MNDRPASDGIASGTRKRDGSRVLLAAALLAGIVAALFLGVSVFGMITRAAGIESGVVRLVLEIAGVIVALPAAFYLVETLFLSHSRRRDG